MAEYRNVFKGTADRVLQAGYVRTVRFDASGDVPVDEAVRDLAPLFADVLADGFTGRRWLIEQIDGFVAEQPCGHVWVEGDAGVGKTALAAHLVRERGWAGHFSRLTLGGSAKVALRNLAGQLARDHGLATDGLLPERWCTPEGFPALLAKITPPLVLVVDGADEAEQVAGAQPWGLPMELPQGVFVVGTYRTGSPPPRSTAPAAVVRLSATDPRNVADVAEHLAQVRPDAAGELVERCGGVWVYLRYVLNEIQLGTRTTADPLPKDLARYYVDTLERWSRTDALLPLLATLGVAGEPLDARTLAALSDVDENAVREHCHRTLRPFLGAVDGQDGRGFALYHASLREFLAGVRPGDESPEQDWKWWDFLRSATIAAHDRIAEHHLTGTVDDGYPLRHLARHLVGAGRDEDLHRLLHADDASGRPMWFAAHDRAGTVDGFLSDVEVARGLHASTTDQALAEKQPASTLCDEVYYQLVTASVVSRTNAIPAELVAALVTGGVWTQARAVTHALRLPTATARAHVLAVLAAETAAQDVLDLALAQAGKVSSPYPRAEVLLKLVPHRPSLAAEALQAIEEVAGEHERAGAIADLVPWLSDLGAARTLAEDLTNPHARARALTALGDRTGALEAVRTISSEEDRANALAVLAPHLSDADSAEALAVAGTITGHHRAAAVAALTTRTPAPDRKPIQEARDEAFAIADPCDRAEALTRLAPLLPIAQRREALTEALAAATAPDDGGRDLPAGLDWPGLTATRSRPDTLTTMSAYLKRRQEPVVQQGTDLDTLLSRATTHTDDRSRSRALTELVPHLSTPAQLTAALASTPYGDRDLLCAVLLRAGDVVADDAVFVALLRHALSSGGRVTCTAILAAALPRIEGLAGDDAAERLEAALHDVHRRWP
ncbi:NACHT domain-containing protein [Lentzea sp. BCCO 10_0061]|uniref:NACHT domain-containing protein n=1 Tax=Lentzea sokolovensis TaxID=3095429 RepID=A0ABU4V553_9PSEU|nr:NACHT domain-containing protein [Lentzea sp. BCCO 10_0061]MDX8146918.1 NACHT domain-containing protein [Lentzea sp. BCCO 10_0061]